MDEKIEIGTSDIWLAAAYLALGATYERADKSNPRQLIFYFSTYKAPDGVAYFDFEGVERDWVNGTLSGQLKRYKDSVQHLKSIIYSRM
jgi:hypothetical protein